MVKLLEKTVNKHICSVKIETVLYPVIICTVCLLYSSLYFFNTYPISEGWNIFDAELVLQGKIPYRDFYYYLPPLNLLIDSLFWRLSFGKLLAYRMWYLFQRIVILLLVYRILSSCFSKLVSFFATIITSFVITACVYDLFGDYNQTMVLLSVCLLFPAIRFAESRNSKYLFWAGILIGLMFLNKQPVFIATCICYFLTLIFMCVREKDSSFLRYCGITLAGIMLSIMPWMIILAVNGSLLPFLEQVFLNVDGKGSLLNLLFINTGNSLRDKIIPVLLFGALFVAVQYIPYIPFLQFWNRFRALSMFKKAILGIICGYAVMMGLFLIFSAIDTQIVIPVKTQLKSLFFPVFLAFVLFFIIGILIALQKSKIQQHLLSAFYFIGLILCTIYIVGVMGSRSVALLKVTFFPSIQNEIVPIAGAFSFLGVLYSLIKRNYVFSFFLCGAFSLYYAGSMGSGNSSAMPLSVTIAFPLMLCILLSISDFNQRAKPVIYGLVFSFCAFIILICSAQKRIEPYKWWGYDVKTDEKISETVLPAMQGIRVTAEEKEMFEEVTRLINVNTSKEDEVWGYPYIKLFNILSDRYTMHSFVPVMFPDVVAGQYVIQSTDLIKEFPPKIILWKNIPNLLKTHESVFLNGEKLKQRETERTIRKMINNDYRILGYYDGIEVYGLKNESSPLTIGNVEDIISIEIEKNYFDEANCRQEFTISIENPLSFPKDVEFSFRIKPSKDVSSIQFIRYNQEIQNINVKSCDEIRPHIQLRIIPGKSHFKIVFVYRNTPQGEFFKDADIVCNGTICE